jgi:hypothetical protein
MKQQEQQPHQQPKHTEDHRETPTMAMVTMTMRFPLLFSSQRGSESDFPPTARWAWHTQQARGAREKKRFSMVKW